VLEAQMTDDEIEKLRAYLAKRMNPSVELRRRGRQDDSVEVYADDEYLGLLFKDDEDPKDISYNLDVAILAIDLE
jgi:hypothetical protein